MEPVTAVLIAADYLGDHGGTLYRSRDGSLLRTEDALRNVNGPLVRVGTLAEYLGVEPVEPPEPDAEEVRRILRDRAHIMSRSDREDGVLLAAAAAWLRERERKQGGD